MKTRKCKELKNFILSTILMFVMVGCSSKEEKYEYEGERMNYLMFETELNTSPFISKEEFEEQADAIIDNIESYTTETREGKAVKESVLELRKREKEFYLKTVYEECNLDYREELKEYCDDLEEKAKAFNEKFIEVLGEDASWY